MRTAEAFLRAQGVQKVELLVRADNLSARDFYDRLGYVTEEVTVMSRRLVDAPHSNAEEAAPNGRF